MLKFAHEHRVDYHLNNDSNIILVHNTFHFKEYQNQHFHSSEGFSDNGRNEVFMYYTLDSYKQDVLTYGLQQTWERIFDMLHQLPAEIFNIESFGELYEIGLETLDKVDKKEHGKYYTPYDVAKLMSNWLKPLPGENICDVCCGTGNLILAYLSMLGPGESKKLLSQGRLWLFDLDDTAIYICKKTIGLKYGAEYEEYIHCVHGDFLNNNIHLPENCKVISNPPYFKINSISSAWNLTPVMTQSKELYAAIMEKIFTESIASVIITPYSFISGKKFFSLREIMNKQSGSIYSFDNVPGCIFNGRKHGIFNTNTTNSVRAAITITNKSLRSKGYQVSPLIRFKNSERKQILTNQVLENMCPKVKQVAGNLGFAKCHASLQSTFKTWIHKSDSHNLQEMVSQNGQYALCVPNSCRYFTVATRRDLARCGKYTLTFSTETEMLLAYAFINSSFCYWHWRLYDGGINYSSQLLLQMPIFVHQFTEEQKDALCTVSRNMIAHEQDHLSYKKNASVYQETVKFPVSYRSQLNAILCDVLGTDPDLSILHSNEVGGVVDEN